MKRILVIDGQGGRLGRQLVKDIAERWPQCALMAVGTNSIAAENMLKAGAARAVGQSAAFRILIPSDRCETWVAGVSPVGMSALVEDALQKLGALLARGD